MVCAPFHLRLTAISQGIAEVRRSFRHEPNEIILHVDPSRSGALKMYEELGFVQHQVLPEYYADQRDAIIMKLRDGATNKNVSPVLVTQTGSTARVPHETTASHAAKSKKRAL